MTMTKAADMTRFIARALSTTTCCVALAACGGGEGGGGGIAVPPTEAYVAFANTTASQTSPLGYVAINVSNSVSNGNAGNLNHQTGAIGSGLLAGTVDAGRTQIALASGGSATLIDPANAGADYAVVFATSGLSNDRFGVVGVQTNVADIPPDGTSTYNGAVTLQADNGDATFALMGDAVISVGWGAANDVDSVFSNLDGVKNDTTDVQNVGTVTILDATLNGSSFSGGTISTTGSEIAYSGGGSQTHRGQFFGPDATEMGGVFGVTANDLELTGVFIASGSLD